MSKTFKIIATVKTHEQAALALSYPNTLLRVNSSHMEVPNLVKFIKELTQKYYTALHKICTEQHN